MTAAIGEFPHGNEPSTGWLLVGSNTPPPPAASQPNISAAGWNVESTAPGTLPSFNIAGALSSLAAGATTSQWDSVSFTDPQSGGGPATSAAVSAWPRNTPGDDNNYAMRATGALVVPVAATYQLGYQGDDGGYLIIRGTGGNPNPSFDPTLVSNVTNAGVVEAEDPTNAPSVLNKLRTEVGTGNSQTIGRIALTPGTYQLEGLVYEGGCGSFWRVVGGIEPLAQEGVWLPLSKGGNVAVRSMLPLIAQPIETIVVTNFTLNAATGAYSLTFGSVAGANYQLEYSTAMEAGAAGSPTTWNIAPGASIAGSAGSTTITGNLTELQAANGGFLPPGSPRVFLRVRRL